MQTNSIVPIVSTKKMQETRDFYTRLLGFEISFDHDFYLGLRAGEKGTPELGFMLPDADHPGEYGGEGLSLGISVENADREHERLVKAGVAILQPPTDQPWGARSFVIRDPNGVTLYFSHPIPASVEYAGCVR